MATATDDSYTAASGGTIWAGGGTTNALSTAAAGMEAGTWLEFLVSNQNAIVGSNSPLTDPPASGGMCHYANNCCYNPRNQTIEMIGQDHGPYTSMRWVRYDLATHRFVLVNGGNDASAGTDSGTGPGHEFCHTTLNPTTGELHYTHYGTVGVSTFTVTKATMNGAALSTALPASPAAVQNITAGCCWWSGAFTGGSGFGAQGGLMIFNAGNSSNSANDGQVLGFDPVANSWTVNIYPASPFYYDAAGAPGGTPAVGAYQEVAAYSAVKNCMVYGGGGAAATKLWKMTSTGAVTAMPALSGGREVGIQHGNLVADPVTGNFLLLTNGELLELNPDGSGTWTAQTGTRIPPAASGLVPGPPGTGGLAPGAVNGMVSTPMPAHGVVAFISQPSQSGGRMWFYKHA